MAERIEIKTRNMWSFISSHDMNEFIQLYRSDINDIFLDESYERVRLAGFNIRVTKIRLGVAHREQGGLFIDIKIIDNRGNNVFNNLHVSIHSTPLGKSQSHITTDDDDFGPRNRLNLNFIKYIDFGEIIVELENPRELNGFFDIHNLTNRYSREELEIINNILVIIIPRGIQNIIAMINRHITQNINLTRSQSVISHEERQTILDNILNMLNIENDINRQIDRLNVQRQQFQHEIDILMNLDRLTDVNRYTIDELYRNIHDINSQLDNLYRQYRENSERIRLLNNRLQPYFTLARELKKKYLKYKQKYLQLKNSLQLKKSLNINDV